MVKEAASADGLVEIRREEGRIEERSTVFRKEQLFFWLLAILTFYLPLAAVVICLNRLMPLEGGLYQWAKLGFNDRPSSSLLAARRLGFRRARFAPLHRAHGLPHRRGAEPLRLRRQARRCHPRLQSRRGGALPSWAAPAARRSARFRTDGAPGLTS